MASWSPVAKGASLATDRVPGFAVDLGLFVYDRLTDRPERHGHPSAEEVARIALSLDLSRLDRALAYQDAIAADARASLVQLGGDVVVSEGLADHERTGRSLLYQEGEIIGLVIDLPPRRAVSRIRVEPAAASA
ncbi:MAG TPA: hypothetical protein VLK65_13290 [Vicinamibacteria bacterium]|nr:hypothetical protein [Vicinamibacteria bacterium]